MAEATRRLAAILAADVAGYSRLMGDDEAATVAALNAARGVFKRHIAAQGGRVVDTAGDSVLATFDSIVQSVTCAMAVQSDLAEANAARPESRRMRFRIGVNLGDVIAQDDGSIYGDGVNIAARLEGLAAPGGIALSGTAFDQVEGKLDIDFAFLGEKEVKNIARKVRVYQAVLGESGPSLQRSEATSPSIAVLPFDNLGGDAEQDYFADGICEDLITELSRLRWLAVTARNSSFTYKGKSVDVTEVGRDLGVRYIVEGSVRRGGNRLRISAQLIDAASGNHLWAERYDRDFSDIFALQDEINETLVATLEREVGVVERDRAHRKPPETLDAWETYQRGMWHCWKVTPDSVRRAEGILSQACDMDPEFAQALASLAYVQYLLAFLGWAETGRDPVGLLETALDKARRAIALDGKNAMAHMALGRVLLAMAKPDDAIAAMERALDLNPSMTLAYFGLGMAQNISLRPQDAIANLDKAIALSPQDPASFAFHTVRGLAALQLGDFETALENARRAVRENTPYVLPSAVLASCLALLGRAVEAKEALQNVFSIDPTFTPLKALATLSPLDPDALLECMETWIEGLRKAGLDA